jgi:hypothetical protein
MVFDLDCEPLGHEGQGSLVTAQKNAVEFKPQVVMQMRCRMLLNDKAEAFRDPDLGISAGLGRIRETRLARYFASSFVTMPAP